MRTNNLDLSASPRGSHEPGYLASRQPPSSRQAMTSFLGSLEAGLLICCAIWGITTTQTITYYQKFQKDSYGLKIVVSYQSATTHRRNPAKDGELDRSAPCGMP
jgi:hypothetical protein